MRKGHLGAQGGFRDNSPYGESICETLSKTLLSDAHDSPGVFDEVLDWVLDRVCCRAA